MVYHYYDTMITSYPQLPEKCWSRDLWEYAEDELL